LNQLEQEKVGLMNEKNHLEMEIDELYRQIKEKDEEK
jgi:hypothetical protein